MGWTTTIKPSHQTAKDFITGELSWSSEQSKNTVIACSMVGTVYYAACRTWKRDDPEAEKTVWAAIFLTSTRTDHHGHNMGWKDMDETVGPVEAKCPIYILDLLTPTTYEHAIDWRARCRAYHEKRKSTPKLQVGQRIKLNEPLTFTDGMTASRFEVVAITRRRRVYRCFRPLDGVGGYAGLCRISNLNDRGYVLEK